MRLAFGDKNLKAESQHRARGEQGRQGGQRSLIITGIKNLDSHKPPSELSSAVAAPHSAACDEGGENPSLSLPSRQNFRVPLDAENEPVTRALYGFDNAIVGKRTHD